MPAIVEFAAVSETELDPLNGIRYTVSVLTGTALVFQLLAVFHSPPLVFTQAIVVPVGTASKFVAVLVYHGITDTPPPRIELVVLNVPL